MDKETILDVQSSYEVRIREVFPGGHGANSCESFGNPRDQYRNLENLIAGCLFRHQGMEGENFVVQRLCLAGMEFLTECVEFYGSFPEGYPAESRKCLQGLVNLFKEMDWTDGHRNGIALMEAERLLAELDEDE